MPTARRKIDWPRVWLLFASVHSLALLWLLPGPLWYLLMRRQGFGHSISFWLSGLWRVHENLFALALDGMLPSLAVAPLSALLAARCSKRLSHDVAGRYLRRLPVGGAILVVVFLLMTWYGDAQSWSGIEVTLATLSAPIATYLLLYCR